LGTSFGIEAPVGEEGPAQTLLLGDLQEPGGDDLVGIHVVAVQHHGPRADHADGIDAHRSSSRASVMRPVTAAAAAVRGLARNVRPPLPWRPSKFRLLV